MIYMICLFCFCYFLLFCHEWGVLEIWWALVDTGWIRNSRSTILASTPWQIRGGGNNSARPPVKLAAARGPNTSPLRKFKKWRRRPHWTAGGLEAEWNPWYHILSIPSVTIIGGLRAAKATRRVCGVVYCAKCSETTWPYFSWKQAAVSLDLGAMT